MAITLDGTTGITTPGLTNTGTETLVNLTTTGNTTLGDASGDTLTVTGGTTTFTQGTANGVAYLNGSKVLTTGSALVFDGSNLGVGVTPSTVSPGKAIEVGFAGNILQGYNSGTFYLGQNWYFNSADKFAGNGRASVYVQNAGAHAWQTSTISNVSGAGATATMSTVMTLDSIGNLGVTSVANPGYGIYVNRNLASTYALGLQNSTNNTGNNFVVFINYLGNTAGAISQNAIATVNYGTASDYRLKENITPMVSALNKVAQLKPVTYKWKDSGEESQGFIAHELQSILPDCVVGEKDATKQEQYEITPAVKDEQGNIITPAEMDTRTVPVYQMVDTSFLVATLTAAIQEQQALITTLTARITALESA